MATSSNADQMLSEELGKAAKVIKSEIPPNEEDVEYALQTCEDLAKKLFEPNRLPQACQTSSKVEKSPTSNLLFLEQEPGDSSIPLTSPILLPMSSKANMANEISAMAYTIIADPKVFLTPTILATYVNTQIILNRPQSFPEVFDLYASKPIAQAGTTSVKYESPKPNRVSTAVPFPIAQSALSAAIDLRDLPLCLSIIDTTVCTTAYKRNKIFRKALVPATALASTPLAAYVLASQLAQLQHSMDTGSATKIIFAGIVAYVGFTSMIGIISITTANDQMDRVTWAKGTPLSARWLREDERALVDQVAGAWGFQDILMRGEEEGTEWEGLREWAGRRKMVLDNPELMEGME